MECVTMPRQIRREVSLHLADILGLTVGIPEANYHFALGVVQAAIQGEN